MSEGEVAKAPTLACALVCKKCRRARRSCATLDLRAKPNTKLEHAGTRLLHNPSVVVARAAVRKHGGVPRLMLPPQMWHLPPVLVKIAPRSASERACRAGLLALRLSLRWRRTSRNSWSKSANASGLARIVLGSTSSETGENCPNHSAFRKRNHLLAVLGPRCGEKSCRVRAARSLGVLSRCLDSLALDFSVSAFQIHFSPELIPPTHQSFSTLPELT
jgi:hypothetical protein